MIYHYFQTFRYARIAEIQGFGLFFIVMWICTSYITVVFFYYLSVFSLQQWFSLKTYRPLAFPAGILIGVFSLSFSSYVEIRDFMHFAHFGLIGVFIEVIIPLFLLGIDIFRTTSQ